MLMDMPSLREIDVRQLAALRAVEEEGSFGRAAAALGFSQAAVSQQIAGLERAAGMPLFDRPGGPRAAVLTPAGRLLLEHADVVLDRLALAERQLDDLRLGVGGRLTVGTFQSVSVKLLPRIVDRLRREAPDLDIQMIEGDEDEELEHRLLSDEFDVTFLAGPVLDPRLDWVLLRTDPFVVVVAAEDCPIEEGPFPLDLLQGTTLVGQDSRYSCQQLIDDGLRDGGVAPRYAFRSNDNGAIQAMAAAGMGPAVMPLLAVDRTDPQVHVHSLDPPLEPRQILLAWRRGRTLAPIADRFRELALEQSRVPGVEAAMPGGG